MKRPFRNVRLIPQMEATECGIACLAMILDYHGQSRPLVELRAFCGTSRDGNSALDLVTGARRLGLEARGAALSLRGLGRLRTPAILHWNLNHFVVLERHHASVLTIVDPASGRRLVPMGEVNNLFSGVALEFRPGAAFERRRRRSISLLRYWEALRSRPKQLALVLVTNGVQQISSIAFPAANQFLIDHVIQRGRGDWMLPIAVMLGVLVVAQLVWEWLRGVSHAALHAGLQVALTLEMGTRLLELPLQFLDSRGHGDLLGRLQAQNELRDLLLRTAQAGFDFLLVVLLNGLMVAYDPFLGGLSLALNGLRVLALQWLRRPLEYLVAGEMAARAPELGAVADATSASEMIKGFGAEPRVLATYRRWLRARILWSVRSERLRYGLTRVVAVIGVSMQAVVLWFGGTQVISGDMTIGVFSGFMVMWMMAERPLLSIADTIEGWQRARAMLERGDDILGTPTVRDGGSAVPELKGRFELRTLGFRYGSGGRWVLRGVDLCIEQGQHLALVGPSGQGKSTLGMLLCGLHEPTEGAVLLDGRDLREYSKAALVLRFGVVLQEPVILEGTLLDNIRLRAAGASLDDVAEAVRIACLEDVVERMPRRYATRLEPMGRNLSGGERQRIAIAQAVLCRPDVLLLDEATSALDVELERRVLANIAGLQATVISVAHREAAIRGADRVIYINGGTATELRGPASGNEILEEQMTCRNPH